MITITVGDMVIYVESDEVEFEDGSTYVCSSEHMFKLGDDWVEINQLKVGDEVASAV
jgi:intein/homing endonuclease